MLVRLFAENFGPFKDGFDLPLEALELSTEGDRGYFEVEIHGQDKKLKLLRLAAIYGANASGKSTVVRAAQALHYMVVRSGPSTQEGDPIGPYQPFLLDGATRGKPCVLGCEVVVDRRIMAYRIAFTQTEVTGERIAERRGDTEQVWLERVGQTIEIHQGELASAMAVLPQDVTRPNAALLSVAAQLRQQPLMPLFHAIRASLRTAVCDQGPLPFMNFTLNQLNKDEAFRAWTLEQLLKRADIGVTGLDMVEIEAPQEVLDQLALFEPTSARKKRGNPPKFIEPVLAHGGSDGSYPMDFDDESSGTQKLLALAGPWYDVIRNGRTLFADELSASLHPDLLMALLEAFNAPSDYPPSQLVLTLHDTSPLEGVLRRDQVFFTEKDDRGVATLFPLSEFKERDVHNLRKRYLQGRYGAVPRALDFRSLFGNGND